MRAYFGLDADECLLYHHADCAAHSRPLLFFSPNWSFSMRTYSAKPAEVEKKWLMIDADGLVLRIAATGTSVVRDVRKSLRPSGGS